MCELVNMKYYEKYFKNSMLMPIYMYEKEIEKTIY